MAKTTTMNILKDIDLLLNRLISETDLDIVSTHIEMHYKKFQIFLRILANDKSNNISIKSFENSILNVFRSYGFDIDTVDLANPVVINNATYTWQFGLESNADYYGKFRIDVKENYLMAKTTTMNSQELKDWLDNNIPLGQNTREIQNKIQNELGAICNENWNPPDKVDKGIVEFYYNNIYYSYGPAYCEIDETPPGSVLIELYKIIEKDINQPQHYSYNGVEIHDR